MPLVQRLLVKLPNEEMCSSEGKWEYESENPVICRHTSQLQE